MHSPEPEGVKGKNMLLNMRGKAIYEPNKTIVFPCARDNSHALQPTGHGVHRGTATGHCTWASQGYNNTDIVTHICYIFLTFDLTI